MAFGSEWNKYVQRMDEIEQFQREMNRGHSAAKRTNIGLGGGENTPPFTQKPSYKRSKSAPPLGESIIEEISPEALESFTMRDTLDPNFWGGEQLNPEVKDKIMEIVNDFLSSIEISLDPEDIRLTGSIANYNWSEYSDVDVHIVVDYTKVDENVELLKSLFRSIATTWNDKHKIKMFDHEVEIYIQDTSEEHHSTGVYSVENDQWIEKPQKKTLDVDNKKLLSKAEAEVERIDAVQDAMREGEYMEAVEMAKAQKKRLKTLRQSGLTKEGEFSLENLVFKILRRSGEIDRLHSLADQAYDKAMSL
jgi:predicted nucleotidyltransferase